MNRTMRCSTGITTVILLLTFTTTLKAQIGNGWVQYHPEKKVHLADPKEKHTTFTRAPEVIHGNPPFASYTFDSVKNTEMYRLFGNRSNRSEIRLFNDYEFGSRQFEGYVTFYAPLNDESLMQIWGSETGATEMMIRGFAENGGSIGINHKYGTPRVMANCYGREIKVNVIHFQEDVGNKIMVFLDNVKVLEFDDNEKPTNNNKMNYHKYGCYGTIFPGHENPVVQWRNVRHFKDGSEEPHNTGSLALKGKLLFEDDFKQPAEYTKEFQPLKEGWKVKAWHAAFKHTGEGLESIWETGHNPVIAYECSLQNVIVEVDFRFLKGGMPENNAYCRVNFTNKELDPKAYLLSTWMNASVKSRPAGVNLEYEKWEPNGNTAVSTKPGIFEPDTWYAVRLEVIGDSAQVTCNGMTAAGLHPKFCLPKTQLVIGVGKSPHQIRRVRVYEALPNPAWRMPSDKINE